MKIHRARRVAPLALVSAILLSGCSTGNFGSTDPTSSDASSPIRIGAVLDITGAGADLGVPERDTLLMLADELNAAGGIDGREVELTIIDDQSTEDGAAKAATTLIEGDDVDIILGASRTGPSIAMRAIAEDAGIPMIALASNRAIIDGSEWVFKSPQNDVIVLERILDDAAKQGYSTLALVRDASGLGEGIGDTITSLGESRGVSLVLTESFEPTATDFTPQMTNVRASDADAVIVWGINPAAALAQKAFVQLGVDKPVYHSHGVASSAFFEAAGDAAEGVVIPSGKLLVADQLADDDPQLEVISKFLEDYEEHYGSPASSFAGYAYDAWNLAVNAIREAGTDPIALRDAIEQTSDLVGVSGVYTMSPEDHSGLGSSALILARAENGRWVLDEED